MWVNRPLWVSQPGRLSLLSFRGRYMRSRLQLDMLNLSLGRRHLVNAYEVKAGIGVIAGKTV